MSAGFAARRTRNLFIQCTPIDVVGADYIRSGVRSAASGIGIVTRAACKECAQSQNDKGPFHTYAETSMVWRGEARRVNNGVR